METRCQHNRENPSGRPCLAMASEYYGSLRFLVFIILDHVDHINTTSRPLYGGGSGVCVYFVYVHIVLRFAAFLRVSFDNLFLSPGRLWVPFGFLWAALDHFVTPWVAMEPDGGRLGVAGDT